MDKQQRLAACARRTVMLYYGEPTASIFLNLLCPLLDQGYGSDNSVVKN